MIDNCKIWMFNRHFPSWKSHGSLGFGEEHQGETQSDGACEARRQKEGVRSSSGPDFGVYFETKKVDLEEKGEEGFGRWRPWV